ncbi:hypothetical protein DIPPA_21098 [Diplonema papillatum]|nr:hypothetical protein DIPPA_21098 [Diplonema papillatum]
MPDGCLWRDNGWGLGTRCQRRRELGKMLEEIGRKVDQGYVRAAAERQQRSADRLSVPRVTVYTEDGTLTAWYAGDTVPMQNAEPSMFLPPFEPVSFIGRKEGWGHVQWQGMTGFVPLAALTLQGRPLADAPFLQTRQGEAWRRNATQTNDILLQPEQSFSDTPNSTVSKKPSSNNRFWMYDSYNLTKQACDRIFSGASMDVTQTTAYAQIKKSLGRMIKKAQKECPNRFGILLDIVTTNSLIQTGIPHDLGAAAYKYMEGAHCDRLGLKFSFVGITDNVNCRAARDVFCRERIRFDAHDCLMSEEPKRSFDALDNQHMYCVYPAPASEELRREELRVIVDRALHAGEFAMPKPTIPAAMSRKAFEALRSTCSEARHGKAAKRRPPAAAKAQRASPKPAAGTWPPLRPSTSLARPSTAPAGNPAEGGGGAGEAPRPKSALAGGVPPEAVEEVAALMRSDPARLYGAAGVLSTARWSPQRGDDDPSTLLELVKAAKAANEAFAAAHPSAGSTPSLDASAKARVTAIQSERQLRRVLERSRRGKIVAVAFGAGWCRPFVDFRAKWVAAAEQHPAADFYELDADRLVGEAMNCLVECVPAYQIYGPSGLILHASEADEELIRGALKEATRPGGGRGVVR